MKNTPSYSIKQCASFFYQTHSVHTIVIRCEHTYIAYATGQAIVRARPGVSIALKRSRSEQRTRTATVTSPFSIACKKGGSD